MAHKNDGLFRKLRGRVRKGTMAALNLLLAPRANKVAPPTGIDIGDAEVLVIMLTHLGDCVIHQPFLAGLLAAKQKGKRKSVHLVVKAGIEDVFSSCEHLTVWPFACPWVGAGRWRNAMGDWMHLILGLRKSRFDAVIVTHPHFLTSLTARLVGAEYVVGFAEAGDRLLVDALPDCVRDGLMADRRDALMQRLGITATAGEVWPYYDTHRIAHGRALAQSALLASGARRDEATGRIGYLCVHPGAGGSQKIWPWRNFVRLIEQATKIHELPVLLVGGRMEIEACKHIETALSGKMPVANLAGRLTVQELFGALHSAAAYIGNDSGPTHLAASAGVPVLAVFGPSSLPDIWKPEGRNVNVAVFSDASFWQENSVAAVVSASRKLLPNALVGTGT